ncbi:hypothetical protein [Catenulispora subtropica]|uniref:Uncharacterized protein n=1 Tax=Catenulispora subtropica TaxID=450798 RepID=A0ABN2RSV8_9ACTN
MSTANEQPGPGLPEEPVESVESDLPAEHAELPDHAEGAAEPGPDAAVGAEPATETETVVAETEDERIARERVEFEKLVAAFHGESAPDPQGGRPEAGSGAVPGPSRPHKIIRYPVLDPRPEWEGSIVEPTDETTADPLDYVEHYEPPDPELPQASAATLASWTMLIGGVVFLVLHTLLGWQTPEYLGWLAIIGVFGGIITLVMRMKPDRDEYDDPDNGAVV